MGHNDLGDFHYERGEFNTALRCYVRTRDYCTTSKHIIAMCLNVIRSSIQMGNFTHVANYIAKAESTPDAGSDPVLLSQLRIAAGLAHLEAKKYKLAARKFLEVTAEHSSYPEIASMQDVALYGGLCALASFDRAELRAKLIDSSSFRAFLELFPQVREAVNDFFHSRYAACLTYLEKLKPDLLLDLHLHDHVAQACSRYLSNPRWRTAHDTLQRRPAVSWFHWDVECLLMHVPVQVALCSCTST